MNAWIIILTAAIAIGSCFVAMPTLAEKRLALVIGIDQYDNLGADKQLRNAVNDARATAVALQKLGFSVEKAENAGRLQINQLWAAFINRIAPGDTVAFYFSGHGIEVDGANYLVPRDLPKVGTSQEELLKSESISLGRILDDLRARKPGISLLILDACRNNPFTDARGRSIGASRGLARVEPPRGTFVMFSAGVGQVALDRMADNDPNPNSIYTRTLLPLLTQPGVSLAQAAREVRSRVRDLALEIRHEQTPAYYDELIGEFYPAGQTAGVSRPPVVAPPPPAPAQPSVPSPAAEAWRTVQDTKSCAVLASFLQQFPSGTYASFARARQTELGCGRTTTAVVPAAPAPPPPPVARELGRFENQAMRATVAQARAVTDERQLVGKYRLMLSVKIENTGNQEFGLGLHAYPNHGSSGNRVGDFPWVA